MIKLLVIEDEKTLLENILDMLHMQNYEAMGVTDGDTGLELARTYQPDLILCDIQMPGRNGFEVLQALRSDSRTATTPFIFLTAQAHRDAMRTGMELGADDYLTKPFTDEELIGAISSQMEKQATLESQRLRMLSHRLMELHESLRHEAAQELGKEVNETIADLHIVLELVRKTAAKSDQARLDQAQELLRQLSDRMREMAFDLRPNILDNLGLVPVLSQLFQRYTQKTQIAVDFEHAGLDQRFKLDTELTAFRIIQEALENVEQHASVRMVSVQIRLEHNTLVIEVQDAGTGFDLESVLTSGRASGLIGMHTRAALLGGDLSIETRRGDGTRIRVTLPAEPRAARATDAPMADPASLLEASNAAEHGGEWAQPAVTRETTETPVRIVLADGQDLSRQGMRSLLEHEAWFRVVGEAVNGQHMLRIMERLKPDVLIIDFALPGMNGLEALPRIRQLAPQTQILILSAYPEEAYVLQAIRNGATGYALKQSRAEELIQAVYTVAEGHRYVSAVLADRTVTAFVDVAEPVSDVLAVLTPRECEILSLVTGGLTNAEIAARLSISPRTAETHRANIMRKLDVRNQAELIRCALQGGIRPATH